MKITDRREVYKDLKIKLGEYFKAMAVDTDSYLVDIASNKEELKNLLNNEKTHKITITDDLGQEVTSYIIRKTDCFTEVNLYSSLERQILEDLPSDFDLDVLARNSTSFVTNLKELSFNYSNLDVEERSLHLGVGRRPFKMLLVYVDNLKFCLSDIQMSIAVGDNCIVIHDKYRDVEYNDILDLLTNNLRVKRYELDKFLKQPYSS